MGLGKNEVIPDVIFEKREKKRKFFLHIDDADRTDGYELDCTKKVSIFFVILSLREKIYFRVAKL